MAPIRALTIRASRSAAPVRAHGRAVREVADRVTRDALPRYAAQATRAVLDIVPIDEVIESVDVGSVIDRVDVQTILDRVDMAALLDRIDIEALLDRVDVGRIIDRVDVQTILDRVDIEALLDRIDIEAVVDRIDVDTLVERTDLGRIIAQSTGGVASGAVDLVRRQGVGLDSFVARCAARIRPRALGDAPVGPPLLTGDKQ
ncbi:MAG: hypothetical protein ACKOBG_07360 [Actinomycetota bacterium]